MSKSVSQYYEARGERYADWQQQRYLTFASMFDEMSWLQLSRYLPDDRQARILDAGCGGGGWSLRMALMGYQRLTLLDLAAACLRGARKIFKRHALTETAQLVQGDIRAIGFADESFDFVFCERDPLEHCVEDQDEAFAELARVLAPGGVLALSAGSAFATKQRLLGAGELQAFLILDKTGVLESAEGPVRPLSVDRIGELFARHGLTKLSIAGRLTIGDRVSEEQWARIYSDPDLKRLILEAELGYEQDERLADASSHIFAAARKLA